MAGKARARKPRKKPQTITLSPNRETVLVSDTKQEFRLELPDGVTVSKRERSR